MLWRRYITKPYIDLGVKYPFLFLNSERGLT